MAIPDRLIRLGMAHAMQLTNVDVYLNGATTFAVFNFRHAAQKESGILKDDVETHPFRGTAGLGGNFA